MVLSLAVTGAVPTIGTTSQFTAAAMLSNGTTQNVTGTATWQSSNLGVVTVNASGVVTAVTAGEADVTAAYSGVTGSQHVVVAARTYRLVGIISDEATGRGITGARVEVLNGLNGGKAVSTDSTGAYAFDALLADSFRMRASADGYYWGDQGVTIPTNPRADFALRRTCQFSVSPTYIYISRGGFADPGDFGITTTPGCAWTATTDGWIALRLDCCSAPLTNVVSGDGSARVYLFSGASGCHRTTSVKVRWNNGGTDVVVEQAPATDPPCPP